MLPVGALDYDKKEYLYNAYALESWIYRQIWTKPGN